MRLGDPLPPYIFVLCLERLSHLINDAISSGVWKPIKASKDGPLISHLLFVDDMLLFTEASVDQVATIKGCIDQFCCHFRQLVSVAKAKIFFLP